MPFGFCNASSNFQRYVNFVLKKYLDDFVFSYANDILIYTLGSLKDYREKVGKVFQKLIDARLPVNIRKNQFEIHEIKYLDFIVNLNKGIMMDPEKVKAIRDWAVPKFVKDVRGLIGFVNFYRKFILTFSDIMRPLTELTKKGKVFH
jgi:hypothetical protein